MAQGVADMETTRTIGTIVSELAAAASANLERKPDARPAPGISNILTAKDHEAHQDLYHHAHADMFPDDWRYEFIQDALDLIAEEANEDQDDPDSIRTAVLDRSTEYFDGRYCYTNQQTGWLHSRADRAGYVDDALEEYGSNMEPGVVAAISLGMLKEYEEVLGLCLERLIDDAQQIALDEADEPSED